MEPVMRKVNTHELAEKTWTSTKRKPDYYADFAQWFPSQQHHGSFQNRCFGGDAAGPPGRWGK
jgi:hypothetical protein